MPRAEFVRTEEVPMRIRSHSLGRRSCGPDGCREVDKGTRFCAGGMGTGQVGGTAEEILVSPATVSSLSLHPSAGSETPLTSVIAIMYCVSDALRLRSGLQELTTLKSGCAEPTALRSTGDRAEEQACYPPRRRSLNPGHPEEHRGSSVTWALMGRGFGLARALVSLSPGLDSCPPTRRTPPHAVACVGSPWGPAERGPNTSLMG